MQWKLKSPSSKLKTRQLEVEEIIDQILRNRDIPKKERENFLSVPATPPLAQLGGLFDQKQLARVVQRISRAARRGEPIVIHGDYDVDGLCATAILWELIYHGIGYRRVHPFLPHRQKHGYGLSVASINEIQSEFANFSQKLLIAVDCGITAAREIRYAKGLGFDVLILDHHLKLQELPPAEAVLHTTKLCAAGIAYVLATSLLSWEAGPASLPLRSLASLEHLSLVALATIADLQPLLGLNRQLVQLGLLELNQSRRMGLQALIRVAGVQKRRTIGPYEVGFMLAPRLNAAGRLGHALSALRLLCTQSRSQAERLARHLNQINQKRQSLTSEALQSARKQVLERRQEQEVAPLVLWHPDWHEGVIGLVAAKLVEEFSCPVVVLAQGETYSKASARSISGFNIIEAIRKQQETLVNAGGHEMAAGFTIETVKLDQFAREFRKNASLSLGARQVLPSLLIDLEMPLEAITEELFGALQKLEPHGIGNPRPTFLARDITAFEVQKVGRDRTHLKCAFGLSCGRRLSAIGFGLAPSFPHLQTGDRIDAVYSLFENEYNGRRELQLKIKDLRLVAKKDGRLGHRTESKREGLED